MINIEKLIERSKQIGFPITTETAEKLDVYAQMLVEANKTTNLTRIETPDDMSEKHFVDCLYACKHIEKGSSVADVGCGAGFPGMVIAIVCEAHVTFVDSIAKKLAFIEAVCEKMNISADIVNERAEIIGRKEEYRERYDYVTARAVARLNTLMEYCVPLVKPNGKFIAMKGRDSDIELEEANNALSILNCNVEKQEKYVINEEEQRSIIVVAKRESTSQEYPRNTKKIAKYPL